MSVSYVEFTQEQQEAWDKYQKLKEKKSAGERAGRDAKSIQTELLEAFGDAALAKLPDGRLLTRSQKKIHRKPQPAADVSWWEINEA